MKTVYLVLLLGLFALCGLPTDSAVAQTMSQEDALALSKKTGRPILAMAGRST